MTARPKGADTVWCCRSSKQAEVAASTTGARVLLKATRFLLPVASQLIVYFATQILLNQYSHYAVGEGDTVLAAKLTLAIAPLVAGAGSAILSPAVPGRSRKVKAVDVMFGMAMLVSAAMDVAPILSSHATLVDAGNACRGPNMRVCLPTATDCGSSTEPSCDVHNGKLVKEDVLCQIGGRWKPCVWPQGGADSKNSDDANSYDANSYGANSYDAPPAACEKICNMAYGKTCGDLFEQAALTCDEIQTEKACDCTGCCRDSFHSPPAPPASTENRRFGESELPALLNLLGWTSVYDFDNKNKSRLTPTLIYSSIRYQTYDSSQLTYARAWSEGSCGVA